MRNTDPVITTSPAFTTAPRPVKWFSVQTSELDYKFNKDETAENIEIIVDNRKPPIAIQSRN